MRQGLPLTWIRWARITRERLRACGFQNGLDLAKAEAEYRRELSREIGLKNAKHSELVMILGDGEPEFAVLDDWKPTAENIANATRKHRVAIILDTQGRRRA